MEPEKIAGLLVALAIALQAMRKPVPGVSQGGTVVGQGAPASPVFPVPSLSSAQVDQVVAYAYGLAPATTSAVFPTAVYVAGDAPAWRANLAADHNQATPWDAVFASAAASSGVPLDLLRRVAWQESRFDPNAKSGAGAYGIMQIVPRWHPDVDGVPGASYANASEITAALNPHQAIPHGARYLADLYRRFGSWRLALAGYNWGPTALANALAAGGALALPAETRNYLVKIADAGGYA